jgi:hypothetical protein
MVIGLPTLQESPSGLRTQALSGWELTHVADRADMASCRSGRDEGEGGFVDYQMTDDGYFSWGAYMWPGVDSDTGLWQIDVFRNSKRIDGCLQKYPCHASYKPGVAAPGVIFTMIGRHQGYLSQRWYQVYGQCNVPGE